MASTCFQNCSVIDFANKLSLELLARLRATPFAISPPLIFRNHRQIARYYILRPVEPFVGARRQPATAQRITSQLHNRLGSVTKRTTSIVRVSRLVAGLFIMATPQAQAGLNKLEKLLGDVVSAYLLPTSRALINRDSQIADHNHP